MKYLVISLILISHNSMAKSFEQEAKVLARDLKTALVTELSKEMAKNGASSAIPFCKENVGPIAKQTAKDHLSKFEVGRTSHKLRNKKNAPQSWAGPFLKKLEGKTKGEIKSKYFIHQLKNSKKIYIEPLYTQGKCLTCHGENIAKQVKNELDKLYPNDLAIDFKLNEFRGILWVKEK